ncbi:hypothetical protein N9811_03430 [Bacteroidia bacterium]|nr:hypothetical protein [Bacteroidia bacterium]
MKLKFLLPLLLLFTPLCNAQTLINTLPDISVIGAKRIGNRVIIISELSKKSVNVMALDSAGNLAWEYQLFTESISGKSLNQVHILGDKSRVRIVEQTPEAVV